MTQALIIVQARMGSKRFPGKSLAEIDGKPILWYLFRQLSYCKHPILPVLATTTAAADDVLAAYGESQGWAVFRGSEHDVLSRYHDAAVAYGAEPETVIVRVTGDDIWPDPNLIDAGISLHASLTGVIDAVFTADDGNLPYGIYVESYTFNALGRAHREAIEAHDREHVSPYIRRESFRRVELAMNVKADLEPLSIDSPSDLDRNHDLLKALSAANGPPYTAAALIRTGTNVS